MTATNETKATLKAATLTLIIHLLQKVNVGRGIPQELARAIAAYEAGNLQSAFEMFENENYHDIASLIYDQIRI